MIRELPHVWNLETDDLLLEVNKEKGFFDVLEKKSQTRWNHDVWEDTIGTVVLREKGKMYADGGMYLDTEVTGIGGQSEHRTGEGKDIVLPLHAASRVHIEPASNTLSVHFDGMKIGPKEVAFGFTYVITLISGNSFQVEIVRLDVDEDFFLHRLLFPLRHGYLRSVKDQGYLVLPIKTGGLYLVGEKVQRPDEVIPGPVHSWYDDPLNTVQHFGSASLTMSWFGARKGDSGFLCQVLDDADADLESIGDHRESKDQDRLAASTPIWFFPKGALGYPRRLRYTFAKGLDYVQMAKIHRGQAIEKKTFRTRKEKAASNKRFDRLPGAHSFEFLLQTNLVEDRNFHPRLIGYKKLWYTFDQVKARVKDLYENLGIRRAMIILLGWNEKGTDNGYPDLWPPNKAAGGIEKLRELIDYCDSLGYLVGLHDCYMFFQEHSESAGDGLKILNPVYGEDYPWDGGQSFVTCPTRRLEMVKRNFALYQSHFPAISAHYSDCIIGWQLLECFDPAHSCDRRQDKESRTRCLQHICENMKIVFGSENALESYVPYSGFFYAVNGYGMNHRLVCVPLWHLVFHECVNHYWEEGEAYNRPGFGAKYDLTEKILYDILWANPSQWNFMCADYEYWREPIKEYCTLLGKISETLADVEMTDFKILSDDTFVQQSTFADGTRIYVNFRDSDWNETVKIPARGFVVEGGKLGKLEGQVRMAPAIGLKTGGKSL
jgi:hypothetical protein